MFPVSQWLHRFPVQVTDYCLLILLNYIILFQRKQEKEIALYGRVLSSDDAGLENEDIGHDGEDVENDETLSGEYVNKICNSYYLPCSMSLYYNAVSRNQLLTLVISSVSRNQNL